MSKRRLRIVATAIALASTFTLSACASNFNAQTNNSYQAAVGSNVRSGPIQVFNALFVDNGDGTATFSGALLAPDENQEIVAASVDGTEVSFGGPIKLDQDILLTIGGQGEIIATLEPEQIGRNINLTLTSRSGDTLKVNTVVVERDEFYDSVAKSNATTEAKAKEAAAADAAGPETETE